MTSVQRPNADDYQQAADTLDRADRALRDARDACGGDYIGLDDEDLKLLTAMRMRTKRLWWQVDAAAQAALTPTNQED